MSEPTYFTAGVFKFLRELEANNDREWFKANKTRFDNLIKEPALRFITDFGQELYPISPHFLADPRPVGGSLFRIYRDTRFAKDKRPYKTNVGLHFRHRVGKDAHAPGFYLHLERGNSFVGVGLWHPDGTTARQIRQTIVERSEAWKKAAYGRPFRKVFNVQGDCLKRPPRGFDPDHPFIDDLKRKDFTALAKLTQKQVTSPGLLQHFASNCRAAAPFVQFLCSAVGVPF